MDPGGQHDKDPLLHCCSQPRSSSPKSSVGITSEEQKVPEEPKPSCDVGEKSQKTKYITLLKISVLFPFDALMKHFNQQIID